jgi:hypothetical protein
MSHNLDLTSGDALPNETTDLFHVTEFIRRGSAFILGKCYEERVFIVRLAACSLY